MLKFKISNSKSGFTLIETLVAIAILILAIMGPLVIASNSLNSAYYANNQVTAFYLAQEGIEYMRYLRDTNFINQNNSSGVAWDAGLTGCTTASPCGIDTSNLFVNGKALTTSLNSTNNINSFPVQYDPSTSVYHQGPIGTYPASPFYRKIEVTPISSNEDKVTVTVYWSVGNLKAPAKFQITENLFNWDNLATGVSGGIPLTASLTTSSDVPDKGGSFTLTWSSTGGSAFTHNSSRSASTCAWPTPSIDPINSLNGNATLAVPGTGAAYGCAYTYKFAAQNATSTTATSTVIVTVTAAPPPDPTCGGLPCQ